jgi:hypothetical protein
VRARAGRSPCSFTLLVPRPYWDPQTDEAAGGHVEGAIGDSDPFAAVEQAVDRAGFDETSSPRFRRASRTGSAATSHTESRRSACLSRS